MKSFRCPLPSRPSETQSGLLPLRICALPSGTLRETWARSFLAAASLAAAWFFTSDGLLILLTLAAFARAIGDRVPSPGDRKVTVVYCLLVAALTAMRNVDVTGPTAVTIDGHPAQRLDLAYPPGLDLDTCRHAGELIQVWGDPDETSFFALAAGHAASVVVADVDGRRVVVATDTGPDATDDDIAERDAIVESAHIAP